MRRKLSLLAIAIVTLAVAACSDITAPPETTEACPVMNGSGRCPD